MATLNSNEHRIITAALETYQSMWAVAVTEAQRENEPIDERFTRERYVEAGELLAKFKAEPEGGDALAMVGKLDANVAAEQARDRGTRHSPTIDELLSDPEKVTRASPLGVLAGAGMARDLPSDRAILDHLDHNLDDLRSADEEGEDG